MKTDKRNAVVVIALVSALTIGVRLLTWFEPRPTLYQAAPLLMASAGAPAQERIGTISYAPNAEAALALWQGAFADDTVYVVTLDGSGMVRDKQAEGGDLQIIVVGKPGETKLPRAVQERLLRVLGSLLHTDHTGAPIRFVLAEDSDHARHAELGPQARDLRDLLVRKRVLN